jgi:hypothetical protein
MNLPTMYCTSISIVSTRQTISTAGYFTKLIAAQAEVNAEQLLRTHILNMKTACKTLMT